MLLVPESFGRPCPFGGRESRAALTWPSFAGCSGAQKNSGPGTGRFGGKNKKTPTVTYYSERAPLFQSVAPAGCFRVRPAMLLVPESFGCPCPFGGRECTRRSHMAIFRWL